MANVVTLPDHASNAIDTFIQSLAANRDREQTRDYQTKQLGIQQQQVDQSGQADQARIQQAQAAAQSGNAQKMAEVLQKSLDKLSMAGPDGIAQAQKIAAAVRAQKPDVGQYLSVQEAPTNADTATGNANKYLADSTGRVAAGGQDAQDRTLTTKAATGAFLPSEAFADQVQRDPLAANVTTPYGQGAAIASGRQANAGEKLTAQTSRANTQANIAADAGVRGATVEHLRAQTRGANLQADALEHPSDAAPLVEGILQDPQSFFALPQKDRVAVVKSLGRAPSKLSAAETDRVNSAVMGKRLLEDTSAIVDKWQKAGAPITGPVIGRYNAKSGEWGESILPSSLPPDKLAEYEQDIAQLREWLTALPIMEAKALAGGRTAYQVIQAVQSTSPSMSKGKNMFAGSVQGLHKRFDQAIEDIHAKQWGGKPPVSKAAPSPVAPAVVTPAATKSPAPATSGNNDPLGIRGLIGAH